MLRRILLLISIGSCLFGLILFLLEDPLSNNHRIVPSSFSSFPSLSPSELSSPSSLSSPPPHSLLSSSSSSSSSSPSYHFGRWSSPLQDITFLEELPSTTLSFLESAHFFARLKRWHYTSFVDHDYFLAFALVQFNYIADVFVYLVELNNPTRKWEYHSRKPLGLGLDFAPSSVVGCGQYADSSFHPDQKAIKVCAEQGGILRVDLSVLLQDSSSGQEKPLVASLAVEPQEDLVLSFPLGGSPQRPAYVHKSAGMSSNGIIQLGTHKHYFDGSAAIDWTKSLALRETNWNWVSVSGLAKIVQFITLSDGSEKKEEGQVVRFGINLSARVYDVEGHSAENAIWVNHTVYPLSGVKFTIPSNPVTQEWRISSTTPTESQSVELRFTPKGSREDHTNFVIVVSEFIQPFGLFNGAVKIATSPSVVTVVILENSFGVVEDHHAVW